MEITNYKERIDLKNEIHLASSLIVLIESIQSTENAIKKVLDDNANTTILAKQYFMGKIDAINEILHTIDILI